MPMLALSSRLRSPLAIALVLASLGLARAVADDEPILAGALPPPAARSVDYERDVAPILSKNCHRCHGAKKQQGGLALHVQDRAMAGGDSGPAIVPGKGAESRLIRYVAGLVEDYQMPPEDAGKPLSAEQIGILRAWIDQGAKWSGAGTTSVARAASDHWSFRPPRRPAMPAVKHPGWVRNPIDAFVLAHLERQGISPSPEAEKATLIRRVSLDLTGLPPTTAEVDAFLADDRPDAYDRLVDRVLASPHFGECWGRHWLDKARYADTNGYEKDRDRSIWPYRDWVIRALNADMPFDRFTIEQIAGDMLPGATAGQKAATGFHRNTMINEEGGIDVEEFRFASVVDRVATTGTVWLGLTVGCAQCHTHKYDPISQREYYRLFAFLDNADEPEIDLPDPAISAKRAAIEREIAHLEGGLRDHYPSAGPGRLKAKVADWEKSIKPVSWTVLTPSRVTSKKHATMTVQPDGSVLASGDKPNNDVYTVELPTDLRGITAIRLEVLTDPSLPEGGPGRAPLFQVGDFLLTEFQLAADSAGRSRPVRFAGATQDYTAPGRSAAMAIDGVADTGWSVNGAVGKDHAAVFELAEDLGRQGPTRLVVTMHQEYIHQTTIGRFRLSATTDPRPVRASGVPADVEDSLLIPRAGRTEAQVRRLEQYYLSVAPELAKAREPIASLRRSMPRFRTTMVMQERRPQHARTTHIHRRGEFLKPAEAVEPGVPAVLHPLPSGAPLNRLTLARWLVDPANPLVGRVAMNHLWQAYFGRGLVTTPEDFGTQGARPTHPELLDWLATELIRQDWSTKAMHRLIVTSATYRQSSRATPEQLARDPRNEHLGRGPRFRVTAEVVRDIALASAGLLAEKMGGPSVFPPQPEGATALAYSQSPWTVSAGADRYRRGLYTFLKRTAPYAASITMDAPTSEATCVRRERSNTPLQALTLLNDAVFVEAARALARRVVGESPDRSVEARARHVFRLCLTRSPRPEELTRIAAFYRQQLERFGSGELDASGVAGLGATNPPTPLLSPTPPPGSDANELAAWTTVARVLLNLDETVTKE
jgi:mono/diheme cytochrome c family protein